MNFDNRFIRELPADLQTGPGTRQVLEAAYSLVTPTPVIKPDLLAFSTDVAKLLDAGVEMRPVEEALSESLNNWQRGADIAPHHAP